jgi:ABC-2 type transport system permease protein
VTSDELLMRKILGIALSGLTTIAAWLLSFFLFITLYQSSQTELVGQILNLSSALN